MRRLWIILGVIVVAGTSAFVLSAHRRASVHEPVSQAAVSPAPASEPPASQPEAAPPKSAPPADAFADAPNYAVAADRAISEFHEGIAVNEWMAHHPGATKVDPASIAIGDECVILGETATLADGTRVARLVAFNPPRAPSPAILPTLQGESLINETCTMSMIQVEVGVSDEAAGRAAQRTINQQFNATYGPSQQNDVGVWYSGPLEIINSYDSGHRLAFDAGKPKFGPSAYVWAHLPIHLMFPDAQNAKDDSQTDSAQFRRAVAIASVDATLSDRMEKLYDLDITVSEFQGARFAQACAHDCTDEDIQKIPGPAGDDWRKPLVPTLRDWLNAVKPLDPNRRAAGLIAADRLLTVFGGIGEAGPLMREGRFGQPDSANPEKVDLKAELEGLGAVLAPDEYGRLAYNGNWLEQARHLSPDTESGKLASFVWLTGAQCQEPEAVVSAGEDLIARGVDAHSAALTHFMLGDAYSDLLLRADTARGRGKAEAARSKALQHYAAGLANDDTSRQARDAWLQSWHIYAGMQPHARYGECGEGD